LEFQTGGPTLRWLQYPRGYLHPPEERYDRSLFPSCSFAAAITRSGSKPNFLWSSLSGAEAPNVFMPMTRPDVPTYRSHPRVDACSTATRALTSGASTLSRYSCV